MSLIEELRKNNNRFATMVDRVLERFENKNIEDLSAQDVTALEKVVKINILLIEAEKDKPSKSDLDDKSIEELEDEF